MHIDQLTQLLQALDYGISELSARSAWQACERLGIARKVVENELKALSVAADADRVYMMPMMPLESVGSCWHPISPTAGGWANGTGRRHPIGGGDPDAA